MQLDMLQADLFSSDSQDTPQATSLKPMSPDVRPAADKASPYKKIDLTSASITAPKTQAAVPAAKESKEEETVMTATLVDVAPEGSSPIGSLLPVLTKTPEQKKESKTPRVPVLESGPSMQAQAVENNQAADNRYSEDDTEMDHQELEANEATLKEKAPGAFKTISEAAGFLGVPQHVLRFWESRFSQIRPLKLRGGRRYYRPEDMEVLSTIKHLLYKQGYTIKGAKKVFSTRNREAIEAAQEDVVAKPPVMEAAAPKAMAKPAAIEKPVMDDKKKKQLSSIRSELLGLREVLSTYIH